MASGLLGRMQLECIPGTKANVRAPVAGLLLRLAVVAVVYTALESSCTATAASVGSSRSLLTKKGHAAVSPAASSKYLYVWAGAANATTGKDALVVIDVGSTGKRFGKVKRIVETPYNHLEPHHCRLSADGKRLACGGLLAALAGLPSVLFFDVTRGNRPRLLPVPTQPSKSAIADEFINMPDGGVLISMMGSETGASPGRIVQYDKDMRLVAEHPKKDDFLGKPLFNPHGIAVDWESGRMISVDFVEPASTLVGNSVALRTTARLWDVSSPTYRMTSVIDLAPFKGLGLMDAAVAHGEFYFTGGNGFLYHVHPDHPESVRQLYDWQAPTAVAETLHVFHNDDRMLVSVFATSTVYLFDTSCPSKPKLLDQVAFPPNSGAHIARTSADGRIAVVATYFLDQGSVGQVHRSGDLTLRVLVLNTSLTSLDPHPTVPVIDFKTALGAKGVYHPHGLAFK